MNVPRPRSTLAGVPAYERPPGAPIDLSDNTNRWGSAPRASAWARSASPELSRYPEAYCASLKAALAEHVGVTPEHVTTGCGSDGVLDASIRAFTEPGDVVAIVEPTFPMPAAFANANAAKPARVCLTSVGAPDVAAIAERRPRVVYLCSPNNPLGVPLEACGIVEIARAVPRALVLVDEAYAEFAGSTFIPRLRECPNVLVVRTFSKAFGLAGARVGYAVGAADVVREVERARGPYVVSVVGARAATIALRWDLDWMRDHVALAVAARERLAASLRSLGLDPLPSSTNFLFVPAADARALAGALQRRGISVRAFEGLSGILPALARTQGCGLRITVGPPAEMRAVVDALGAAMGEPACV